ncbi:MAG: RNA polymerase sigma factor [Myxococcota bacterium]
MTDIELPDRLRDGARAAWYRYLGLVEPIRPALHRYCRGLTGDLWDAEDLVQDTLLRGFGVMGSVHQPIRNPRAYLTRTATNLWLDTVRRRRTEATALEAGMRGRPEGAPPRADPLEVRDAGAALLERLSPQERCALLLKDVFDMPLDEIAQVLGTTVGAVKAALHRGRGRLREPEKAEEMRRPQPSPALVERFVECMRSSDLPGLLALMLDSGSIEVPGSLLELGRAEFEREGSWLWQSCHVHPELPKKLRPKKWEAEAAVFRGEPVMLSFSRDEGGERRLQSITRFEEHEERIARVRAYYFCPETLQVVAEELGVPLGPTLYRLPLWMAENRRETQPGDDPSQSPG